MCKEIGSNFWLDKHKKLEHKQIKLDYPGVEAIDTSFVSTGRSAISFVLNHIKIPENKKIALLPPFTCHTVIEPFINAGYKVFFHHINKDLSCSREFFLRDIKRFKPALVLVHGYFGFNTLGPVADIISDIKEKGITVIEDITQTLYSEFRHIAADYYICSFRKWAALPDGGCAISAKTPFSYKPVKQDSKLQEAKLGAFHAKYLYINKGIGLKNKFLEQFREAEQILAGQNSIFAMSEISKVLQANLNIDFIRGRRRKNFNVLAEGLANSDVLAPVFNTLDKETTPLYFPVYVRYDRKKIQDYLAGNNIYAPIIWPKPSQCEGLIDLNAEWIYQHILAIPCDQRYDNKDMERIINVLEAYRN